MSAANKVATGGGAPVWLDTLSTADRVNLLELYGRSVMLLELGRSSDWVDLFVPHALLRCGSQQFRGRAELLEFAQRMVAGQFDLAVGYLTPPVRCRHSLSDVSLFADGAGRASGFAHLTVSAVGDAGTPRWLASGMYSDKLSKCGAGCWRFDSRVLTSGSATTLQPAQQVTVVPASSESSGVPGTPAVRSNVPAACRAGGRVEAAGKLHTHRYS
jgi:hypothetical protein